LTDFFAAYAETDEGGARGIALAMEGIVIFFDSSEFCSLAVALTVRYCLPAHTNENLRIREWVLVGSDHISDGFVVAN
jgi:hypothetical protein